MSQLHSGLTAERWNRLSLCEQMANIGSEVERAINWREKGNEKYSQSAFDRALELIDLTLTPEKSPSYLRELFRVREALADYLAFDNTYNSTAEQWKKYFLAFNYAARKN